MNQTDSNVSALLAAGRAIGSIVPLLDGIPTIVIPEDYELESLEQFLPAPIRKKAMVRLTRGDSFIEYLNRHKTSATTLFVMATDKVAQFRAIIDYHEPKAAHWSDHQVCLECIHTGEWKAWMDWDRKKMDQVTLAQFLEEHELLFKNPSGAALLEMARTLEGKASVRFNSAIRLNNGCNKLDYEEDVELRGSVGTTQGTIEIPSMLVVGLVPFHGVDAYEVSARLRYRIEGRKLTFWYETISPHLIIRDACDGLIASIEKGTGLKALLGTP